MIMAHSPNIKRRSKLFSTILVWNTKSLLAKCQPKLILLGCLSEVSISLKQKVINLVNERLISTGARAIDIEQEIDQIAVGLYQLTPSERHLIGM